MTELITIDQAAYVQLNQEYIESLRGQLWEPWLRDRYGVEYWGVGNRATDSWHRARQFRVIDSKKALIFQLKYA